MDAIFETAEKLGYMIQENEWFIKMRTAQTAADEDKELQELIGQFNLKRMAINEEASKDEKDNDKMQTLNADLRDVYAKIMANEHMIAYNDAKTGLDKIVGGVTARINMAAQGMDPAEYEENANCSGDCGSCGGCH